MVSARGQEYEIRPVCVTIEEGRAMKGSVLVMVTMGTMIVLAATALAALPKKGASYAGDIKSSPFKMHIDMKVNATGRKLSHFTYLCGTGRPPTTVFGVAIDSTGHFKWTKMVGSVLVWKMAGHFVSPSKAFVSLNSIACGGSKGSTTVKLKA
jgi:hypothetical protein